MNRLEHKYKNKKLLIVGILLTIIFFLSIVHLFRIRFKAGDIYPPYSSLRSGPLGVKVLFESLNSFDKREILRNYRVLSRLKINHETTFFYFGVHAYALDYLFYKEYNDIEALVNEGARVVISLIPEKKKHNYLKNDEQDSEGAQSESENNQDDTLTSRSDDSEKDFPETQPFSLLKKWGITYDIIEETDTQNAYLTTTTGDLPHSIIWQSFVYFDTLSEGWNIIYTFDNHPVVIEKKLGKGTIILSSDSYFLSNEAMLNNRYPALLSWIAGAYKTIIFDERHHGIQENRGISGLAQKYRLHGVFAGILILAALFIWKNSYSLIPPVDEDQEEVKQGSDYTERLVNLLQRHIPSSIIIKHCVQEWEKTLPFYENDVQANLKKVKEMEIPSTQSPLDTYNKIYKILAEGNKLCTHK